jgi:hypothetical protein
MLPAEIVLVLTMPPPGALMPKMVMSPSSMPYPAADIVPPLLTLAENIVSLDSRMPMSCATIDPVLVMPPPAEPSPNAATLVTKMPPKVPATILPPLLMPPPKVVPNSTLMPFCPPEIVPEFLMPPRKVVTVWCAGVANPT